MADQSTSENTPESPKEGTTPTDLWNCCLMGPDKMDVVPSSEDQQLLTLSSTQTYDGQAVAGLEAVSDYPSSMYGPYLPDEVEHLSTDVKAVDSSSVTAAFMHAKFAALSSSFSEFGSDGNAEVGVCGLKNLGNTCFMNSGLQCLLSCPSLCCFLLEEEKIPKDSLIEKFSALVCKFWSGEYSVLHPSEFKETLGFVHTQFKDYRQHDGQEFLALLLDSLHEELNHAKELHNEEDVSEVSTDAGEKETEESTSDVLEKNEVEEESEESRSEMSVSEQEESMDTSILEDSSTQDNVINITKLPSIEEFYMKDVKTLNTNVLREDSPTPMIAVDSDKFPKNDKSPTSKQKSPLKNMVENMNDTSPRSPRFKKTNLPVDKKNRFGNLGGEEVTGKITLQDMDEERDLESIKRMKMDDDDGGTILKSLLLQGRDVIREGPYDVFNVSQDMEEVQKMKDIVMCRRKDTNLYANTASKFPISANNESCNNTFNSDEKLGKFALEPFTIERNLDYKKTETLDIVVESIAGCSQDFKALVKDATVCKHIPFANNQTILVDKAALSKNPCSSALTTDRVGVNEQRASREEIEFFEAEKEWHKYLQRNRSVIIDTFQGQFKSTVICSSCDHVSVTFEPFMYLSLPLPHGMERQIAVTWVPLNRLHYPTRYLFNLLKMETVRHLRSSLVNMVFGGNVPPPNDIILAEVFDNHVARILEDGTHLRYVNDDYRMIYAFEMSPKPESELESQQIHPNNLFSTFSDFAMVETGNPGCNWNMKNDDDVITEAGDVCTTVDDVIVEGDDISSRSDKLEDPHCEAGDVVMQSSESDTAQGSDIFSNIGYFDSNLYSHTCTDGPASSECIGASGDADMTTDISAIASTSQTSDTSAPIDSPCTDNKNNEINVRTEDFNTSWVPNNADMKPWSDGTLTQNNTATTSTVASGGISSDWRSCAICLEELPDHELLTHMECGGALCHICLEATSKHYGLAGLQCPVCTIEVNPAEDFVAAPPSNDTKSSRRVLTLPVQFRYDYEEDGQLNMKLFGHPSMIYMGNKVQGEVLFSAIERLMPYQTPYKVVLTDGQGYHCSRCMYNLHCNGCELVREVEITLQSDDHLTVVCADVSTTILQYSQQVTDHESMKDLRSTEPLTLQECFYAFTESEILDEHNPWYCPKCERNQCARKTLTVWRYPDTLVVYLKRFVFHELCSTKLDNKVLFPVENLDVSSYTSGPTNGQSLTYDLQSAVCHFGGVNAGHYTAFTKNPLTNQWCYFNDEMTTKQEPTSEDAASVYVLFYQKKGIQHDFYSALRSIVKQEFQTENSDSATAETREGCDLNHDEIDLLLQQLQSPIGADTSCAAVIPGCSKQSSTGATSCATVTGLDIKF